MGAVSAALIIEVILGMNILSSLIEQFAIADVYYMVPGFCFKDHVSLNQSCKFSC